MYEFNMAINIIISALIVIQSALSLPFTSLFFAIDSKASVFESGDDMYTVIWSTTLPGTGYVTYTYEGKEYTVKDEKNAALRTEDSVHSVRIPKKHLDGNTYTYHSQHIATKRAYVSVKGRTVSSDPVEFKGYSGQDEIHAMILSDIHENPLNAQKAVDCFDIPADLLIMNGDEVSMMTSERNFKQVLQYAYRFSGGSIPIIYTRGNHENRGEYGSDAIDIFKTTTGGLYYTCSYGPLQFICLDSGEDKSDDDWTYGGLVDYTAYVARETEWMKSLTPDEEAQYRIAVSHIPHLKNRYGNDWSEILTQLGVDLFIGGHKHRIHFEWNSKDETPFYQMLDGGKNGNDRYIATMLTIKEGQIDVLAYDNNKELRGEHTYYFGPDAENSAA